jgi:hypothetical protein
LSAVSLVVVVVVVVREQKGKPLRLGEEKRPHSSSMDTAKFSGESLHH